MMTLNDLLEQFAHKSSLQRAEHTKKLAGMELQVVGELLTIAPNYLSCRKFHPTIPDYNSVMITHEGTHLREKLLAYESGDIVKMNVRFTTATFGEFNHWTCSLDAIDRIQTEKKRRERKAAATRATTSAEKWGQVFGFYFAYLLPVLTFATMFLFAMNDNGGAPVEWQWEWFGFFVPFVNWLFCLLMLLADNPVERNLFFTILTGWAIAGAVGFVISQLRRWVAQTAHPYDYD